MTAGGPYLVDGRWLGRGGPGRVVELTLRSLAELAPDGEWLVWGPPEAAALWPAAELVVARHDPHAWWSQREVPGPRRRAVAAFFPHQMRPMWRLAEREVTILHDTIPLRHGSSRLRRVGVKALLLRGAALSDVVLTGSAYAKATLVRDLGLDPDGIVVSAYPPDPAFARRVRQLRPPVAPEPPVALFVGRASPHKNLDRLVDAFGRTTLHARGGELVLAGVDGPARSDLAARAAVAGARVRLPGIIGQDELDLLMARAAVLVQPSLEEGFGLPVVEALQAGIPVAVSQAGPLVELTGGAAPSFDPLDVDAMAAAIDAAATGGPVAGPAQPTPVEFARTIVGLLTGSPPAPAPLHPTVSR